MAKLSRAGRGQRLLENVNEEAVVSSSSGFLSGEDDAGTSSKGKGPGRKAKKEVSKEVDAVPAQKIKPIKAAGTGRGRKKLPNKEEQEQSIAVKPVEEEIVEEKPLTTKERGKKIAEVAVKNDQKSVEHTDLENGVEKAPPKRGRKAASAATLGKISENNSAGEAAAAPAPKKRGRGKKVTAMSAALVEETTATQQLPEKPSKQQKQKKSNKEIQIDAPIQISVNTESVVENTKKKATKSSTVKVEQIEPTEEAQAVVEPKKTKARGKALKQEPEEEQIVEDLEKPTKGRVATKRKAVKKEPELEKSVLEDKPELNGEDEKGDDIPTAKKKSKKEPKAKKPKETKPRAKVAKAQEQDTGEKLENAIKGKDKTTESRKRTAAKKDELDGAKPPKSKKTDGALINATVTKYNKEDFKLHSSGESVQQFNFKISSWNVAGLRSWLKKDGLRFLEYELPDIFCLQEIKCTTDQLPEEVARIPGYHPYWLCMPGGYAGVAIYSKIMPINILYGIGNTEFDSVGRMITAEYEKFFLINVYVPNSGRKLVNLDARMRWEKLFQEYVKRMDGIKPVVICGDMNVSHQAIDLANPKTNTRSAGFTQEERDKMTELLALGFVDSFRHLYPDRTAAYTYWTYMANARSRNVGWRLDYFIVSERFTKRVVENCIRSQVMGSDHCPITLFLKM